MIHKEEILDFSRALQLPANTIEKDYILGWLLLGIKNHPLIEDSWRFKGGTCLKKCFFETYRFSEDLDFTIANDFQLTEDLLLKIFSEIALWVAEESGIQFPEESIKVELFKNPRGKIAAEARVGYIGPLKPRGNYPKVKFDLSKDEVTVQKHDILDVYHPYSDLEQGTITTCSYTFEETFAEKIRALGERSRPRDLYDIIHLYRNRALLKDKDLLLNVLNEKCLYKNIPIPSLNSILSHPKHHELSREWSNMMEHQLPLLPPLNDFLEELPEFFLWLTSQEKKNTLPTIKKETSWKKWVPTRMQEPSKETAIIERIQYAASNRLCAKIKTRWKKIIGEPYSLDSDNDSAKYLTYIEHDAGTIDHVALKDIRSLNILDQSFTPKYLIEITGQRSFS